MIIDAGMIPTKFMIAVITFPSCFMMRKPIRTIRIHNLKTVKHKSIELMKVIMNRTSNITTIIRGLIFLTRVKFKLPLVHSCQA
jgi:hypothetical protein